MHLRKLTLVFGMIGALFASWAHGLGMGGITLNSALNEPLDAEIELLQVRDLNANEVIVELAGEDDFERAGVERVYFLQGLEFEVMLNNPGGPIVKVTSEDPVREPYLNFLVETQWPSGRLLREYTVLLDIPVFAEDEAAEPVQPAQPEPQPQQQPAQRPAQQPQQQVAPQQPTRPQQAEQRSGEPPRAQPRPEAEQPQRQTAQQPSTRTPAPAEPTRVTDDDYAVQANDTLWEIALRVRPNSNLSVQQTMLALQRLNPDAFINDNINLLKEGQVLRIPDQSEINSVGRSQAVEQVAYQNEQWSSGQAAGAQLEAGRTRPREEPTAEEPRGELTLAAPGDTDDAAETSGTGDAGEREALENELAIAMEELDSAERENAEIEERVADLDEQIETMERLLEVSNQELRDLQAVSQAADGADATPAPAEPEQPEAEQPDQVAEAETETETEAQAEPEQDQQPAQQPQPVQPEPSVSIIDVLMQNIWYLLIGVGVLIGGVAYIMHRRAQAEMAAFDAYDDDEDFFAEDDEGDLDTRIDTRAEEPLDDEFDLEPEEEPTEPEPAREEPTQSETGDAVGEADIYIAYGKLDQAAEMLQRAILEEPDNIEARLKLLEVYAESDDLDKFDREYEQLMAIGDERANQRAAELRQGIAGAGAAPEPAAASPQSQDQDLDFGGADLSLDSLDDFGDSETGETPEPTAETASFGDADTDLGDLDLDLGDSSWSDTETEAAGETSEADDTIRDDDSFDFELDLEGEDFSAGDDVESQPTTAEADSGDAMDFDFDLESGTDTAGGDEGDLSLDLDLDETSGSDDTQTGDLTFDLDLDEGGADTETGGGETETTTLDTAESDDDFLSDLEFTTTESETDETAGETSTAGTSDADQTQSDQSQGGDFDLEMGDVDLEALDKEMDDLVGDLDDIDDEDVPVAPTESVPALDDETLSSRTGGDSQAGGADEATDLDDMISLDEPELSDLALEDAKPEESKAGSGGSESTSGSDALAEQFSGSDDLDSELDFLADSDEVATKLDLARAYIDMGDKDGAKDILEEVTNEGNEEQKLEAQELIGRI